MTETRASRSRLIYGRHDQKQARVCMCCREVFVSYGRFNRLCSRCKHQDSDFSLLGADTTRR